MSFSSLEAEGLIKRVLKGKKDVADSFALAKRDALTAEALLKENADWSYSIAYNSMLQATRALMFSEGYRPSGDAQHVSAVRFAKIYFDDRDKEIIAIFERMRRKRHTAVYGLVGTISKTEAESAVARANDFLEIVEKMLKSKGFL